MSRAKKHCRSVMQKPCLKQKIRYNRFRTEHHYLEITAGLLPKVKDSEASRRDGRVSSPKT